jgi:hypothetical protein
MTRQDEGAALTHVFDRRKMMRLAAGSAAGVATAVALVEAAAGPAAAATSSGGTFGSVARAFFKQYAAGKWAAMERKFDPNIFLFVRGSGELQGPFDGPAAVLRFFQDSQQAGFVVSLQGMAGFEDYSLAVYECTDPAGAVHQSALALHFTAEGLVNEGYLFGLT